MTDKNYATKEKSTISTISYVLLDRQKACVIKKWNKNEKKKSLRDIVQIPARQKRKSQLSTRRRRNQNNIYHSCPQIKTKSAKLKNDESLRSFVPPLNSYPCPVGNVYVGENFSQKTDWISDKA